MIFPIDPSACPGIPINHHPGAFGFHRPWNYHPGVDLYTKHGETVYAIEDGTIVSTGIFTGPEVGSNWWETTWFVMVQSKSGVFNYGEIQKTLWSPGDKVKCGQEIGKVKRVLFEDKLRPNIPGHSTSMLHLELYTHGSIQPVEWVDRIKPSNLLDPTPIILPLWLKTQSMTNFQWDNSK